MYVLMVSMAVRNGMDSEAEMKRSYSLLSLAERPRSYIADPHNIAETGGEQITTFFMVHFMSFMRLANNPESNFLDPNVNPNEEILMETKNILHWEKNTITQ